MFSFPVIENLIKWPPGIPTEISVGFLHCRAHRQPAKTEPPFELFFLPSPRKHRREPAGCVCELSCNVWRWQQIPSFAKSMSANPTRTTWSLCPKIRKETTSHHWKSEPVKPPSNPMMLAASAASRAAFSPDHYGWQFGFLLSRQAQGARTAVVSWIPQTFFPPILLNQPENANPSRGLLL